MEEPADYKFAATILIVDDNKATQKLLTNIITRNFSGLTILVADNGLEGYELFKHRHPDIVMADICMPVMDGIRMADKIRSIDRDTKIIMFTAVSDANVILETIDIGINHYLLKPFKMEKLISSVQQCLRSVRLEHRQKEHYEYIRHNAYYDSLTDLPNRQFFHELLRKAITQAQRFNRQLALLFVDINRFKFINDTLGHIIGDQVLKSAAERLAGSCRRGPDTVARWGGDEFIILLTDIKSMQDPLKLANKLSDAFSRPLVLPDHEISVEISMGVSLFPDDGTDVDTLIDKADMAMYRNKRTKKPCDIVCAQEISDRCTRLQEMERELRQAQINGEFVLNYQPEVDIASGDIVGIEALLRWQHPKLGLIMPERFIGVAEETGLIDILGEWVLRTACSQNKAWQDAHYPPVRVSVNVSNSQLRNLKLTETVRDILSETELAPCWLELEIGEDILAQHHNTTVNTLNNLHNLGVRICIDNFGTGMTALAAIRRYPVDALKIDRTFISRIAVNSDDAAIARTIIAIARNLGLSVIAEGVEDEEQRDYLQELDCTNMQGYLISKPLRADDFTEFFSEARSRLCRQVVGSTYLS